VPSLPDEINEVVARAREIGVAKHFLHGMVDDAWDRDVAREQVREVRDAIYHRLVGEGCPFREVDQVPGDRQEVHGGDPGNELAVIVDRDDGVRVPGHGDARAEPRLPGGLLMDALTEATLLDVLASYGRTALTDPDSLPEGLTGGDADSIAVSCLDEIIDRLNPSMEDRDGMARTLRQLGVHLAERADEMRVRDADEERDVYEEAAAKVDDALDLIDSAIRTLESTDEDGE
jgi:hypothetical protein